MINVIPNPGIQEYVRFVSQATKEISIVVFPRQEKSIDELAKPYQGENYEKRVIELNGMTGQYFNGGIPALSFHQKVALFQKGYSIIRLQLSYAGEVDSIVEAQYDAMLASLR